MHVFHKVKHLALRARVHSIVARCMTELFHHVGGFTGVWPGDDAPLNERLKIEVIKAVIGMEDVVFFAFEFPADELRLARNNGFRVYQLVLELGEFVRRNHERLMTQPDNNAFQYLESNLKHQAELFDSGVVDQQLDASLPSIELAALLLSADK